MQTGRQVALLTILSYNQYISSMIIIIFLIVHQPSFGGSCDDEDSWCSESAGREVGAVGMMEGGDMAVDELSGVATLLGEVSSGDVRVVSFLKVEAKELRDMTDGEVVDAEAVVPAGTAILINGEAGAVVHVAEGMKGFILTLWDGPTANAER